MKKTQQEEFWTSDFGAQYTERNQCNPKELDKLYVKHWGVSRGEMNNTFLKGKNIHNILEVGCNSADQLQYLQTQGYKNLYGIEIQEYAFERAKQLTRNISLLIGSAFDLPFRDKYFDMVYTSGVLIHIHPDDMKKVMSEIYRTSKKYIWGFESFAENFDKRDYRGNDNRFWRGDYAKKYIEFFPDLKLVKSEKYKFIENDNIEMMYLFEKP